ncbi:MAG: glycosyltransferase family 2 protein [Polyangiales bacterium]
MLDIYSADHSEPGERGHVAILMCTYRGAKYLRRQLETVFSQRHANWTLYASDDGSDDDTLAILDEFRKKPGGHRIRVFDGPRRGFACNFFSLIARPEVSADFYAFTDQDDEWDDEKLTRAVNKLKLFPADAPMLYASRSELVDQHGGHIGYSRHYQKPPQFSNALVQNMASGNTMVLNHAAIELIRQAGTDIDVSAHDWWAYLIVTGSGGLMVFDQYPTIRYRQHGHNLYGSNVSLKAMWTRVAKLFAGDFRAWNDRNLAALRASSALLHEDSRRALELFERARTGSAVERLWGLMRAGVYRQTWDGQLGLAVAAITKRI